MHISNRLLSVDSPKAIKSLKFGWLNAIHYMAPADIAGVGNLCPHASEGCKALCLGYHSGQASMVKDAANVANKNNVRESRDTKTRQFMADRQAYMAAFEKQMLREKANADAAGLKLCVRFDGSTDTGMGLRLARKYPEIQFTDYTKNKRRALDNANGLHPANYSVTFSRSEINEADCLEVLSAGGNVAAVFAGTMPDTWQGYRVVSGDEHDLRHLDPHNVVIGLTPKGAAKKDTSGFVVR
jgi:hypothetical protein